MKKQITSKRNRRFDEGGFISSESQEMPRARTAQDDREAADKAEGLAASNKEKSTGFFERLRMGNIDDPNSEAYRRLGAGRGRAERAARVPVEDVTPTPVMRNQVSTPVMDELEAANAREPIKVEAGPREEIVAKPSVKPTAVSKPASKPAKEYDPTAGEAKDKAAQVAADAINDFAKPKGESIMKKTPVTNATTFNAYGLNNFSKPKAEEEKSKSSYKKNSTYAPSGKKAGTSKSTKGNDVDFGGTGLGMKSGGSVSKASNRADGIAQRGKTRGKMC